VWQFIWSRTRSWNHLKKIVSNLKYITNIVNIANACINLSHWSLYFKKFTFIIVLKPNRSLYNSSKVFWPIVLLNMSCKLIRKAISNRLQVHSVTSNFLYPNQLDSIRQCLMTNASIFLTHTSGIDKRSLYKHSCIQHCSILLFLESPTPSNNSKQSRFQY